jgi:hypothetical protein
MNKTKKEKKWGRKSPHKWPYPKEMVTEAICQLPKPEAITREQAITFVNAILFPVTSPNRKQRRTNETTNQKFIRLLASHDFRSASRSFDQLPIATINEKTKKQIEHLYPAPQEDQPDMQCPSPKELDYMRTSIDEVKEELDKMRIAAPGRSGISIKHLRQLFISDERAAYALTMVINIILLGEDEWKDQRLIRITEARGLGLVKDAKTEQLRPIGINEALLNLAARLGLNKQRDKITKALNQADFGFNRSGGTENINQVLNTLREKHRQLNLPFILLQIDFENAFNSTFRKAIFNAIRKHCPGLLPFARLRYHDLKIFYEDAHDAFTIHSKAGVSQGCPCSPAFFQLVLSEVMAQARKTQNSIILTYLDDSNTVCRDFPTAKTQYDIIKAEGEKVGLRTNVKKNGIVL